MCIIGHFSDDRYALYIVDIYAIELPHEVFDGLMWLEFLKKNSCEFKHFTYFQPKNGPNLLNVLQFMQTIFNSLQLHPKLILFKKICVHSAT